MALGAWGGIALASLPAWREVSFTGWLLGHAVLVAPTVCQPWFQWKPYKIAARWLLGAACASWVIGAIEFPHMPEPAWVTRALCLAWMFIASRVLLKIRERKTRNPCLDCPLGVYPTCEWNLPRLLAENQDEGLNEALRVTHGRAELAPSVE